MSQLEIVQLTQEQYETCKNEGQVTVGDKTVFFNPNALYCIPTDYAAPTSASLFRFQDNKIKDYIGPDQDIVLPKTYSKSIEIENRLGAPFKEEQFMMVKDIIRDFSSVQFCRADGTGTVTYTDYDTFYSEFDSVFPIYDDCLLMNVTFEAGFAFNADMLSEVLANPIYVDGNIFEGEDMDGWSYNEEYRNWIMQQIEQDPEAPISLSFTGEYEIPTFFDGTDYIVDTIGLGNGNGSIISNNNFNYTITIPDGYKTISQGAFTGLQYAKITMPNSIETIGDQAFYNCTSAFSGDVVLPTSLTNIGNDAFHRCTMNTITIGKNCTNISVTFPDSSQIYPNAFLIQGLTEIIVDPENPNYTAVDGILYDKNITTLISIPAAVNMSTYTIPSTVTKCANYSIYANTTIHQIDVGENVETLGYASFSSGGNMSLGTSPIQVVNFLGTKITQIPGSSFSNIQNLTQLTLPNGLQRIEGNCFDFCNGLKQVTIPQSLEYVSGPWKGDHGAFRNVILDTLDYGGTVDDWISAQGLSSFMSQNTVLTLNGQPAPTSITITQNVPEYCFQNWGLTTITIQEGVTNIGARSFYGCDKCTAVYFENDISSDVNSIGWDAFRDGNSDVIYYVKDQQSLTNIQMIYDNDHYKFTNDNFKIIGSN